MGVIYKLKSDVVDYILKQKRNNPAVSCRGLVFSVKEKFKCEVSKSSINNVLQEAQLSSPVGRRSLLPGAKKFSIPETREKDLFDKNLKEKFNFEDKVQPKKPQSPPVKERALVKVKLDKAPAPPEMSKKKLKQFPDDVLRPKLVLEKPKTSLEHIPRDKGAYYDGMGSFFLKAAEWLLCEYSIMGRVLSNYLSGYTHEQINNIAEAILYLEAFNIKEPTEIIKYQGQGLWVLNKFKGVFDFSILIKILEDIKDIKGFNIALSNEIDLAFKEIANFKVTLSDSTEFFIDANFATLSNVQTGLYCPNQKAVKAMSKQIINNILPTTLLSVSSTSSLKVFLEMVSSYENLTAKQIKKITLMDPAGQEVVNFTTIPSKRRYFIGGLWPWQIEFSQLQEESEDLPSHYYKHPLLGKDVYYVETYSSFLNDYIHQPLSPLRVIFVKEAHNAPALFAILTNFSVDKMSSDSIIYHYLLRWPNLQRSQDLAFIRQPGSIAQPPESMAQSPSSGLEVHSLHMNFKRLFSLLTEFSKKYFFPFHYHKMDVSDMIANIYALGGFLTETAQFIVVHLQLPTDYPFREDLEFASKRLNEKEVLDPQGRRLLVFIEEKPS